MERKGYTIKDIVIVSIATTILFVSQMALSFLPNIQVNVLLIILYTKVLGFRKTSLIIVIQVIVYNFLSPFGAMMPVYIPFMMIAWLLIPILLSTIIKRIESDFGLAIFGFIFSFIFGWILLIPAVLIYDSPFLPYLIADLPFEILMAVSSFLSIYLLYNRLKAILIDLITNYYNLGNNTIN